MSDEVSEQCKLLCRKFDWSTSASDFIAADVDLDIAESINLRRERLLRGASKHSFHPGHQLTNGEWLGNVVIGAQFQAYNLVDFLATRCQHDDGEQRLFGLQLL